MACGTAMGYQDWMKDLRMSTSLSQKTAAERTDVKGIYLVKGIIDMPFQIVMTSEIEGEECRNNLYSYV